MSLILSGSDGLSDVDGSASTPAIRGTDANTGIFFGADIIGFSEGGAECARFNADSQFVSAAGTASLPVLTTTGDLNTGVFYPAADTVAWTTGGSERARITSGGDFLVGRTSSGTNNTGGFSVFSSGVVSSERNGAVFIANRFGSDGTAIELRRQDATVGSISVTTTATTYNTSSDYRLKENIAPMTGALAKVAQLNPCTFTWKNGGHSGQGFIAHELQEVCPDAVVGEKDAIETYTDDEGNEQTRPRYQGVDTSFLVATLTAAIQELKAELDAAKARIAVLEAK